MVTGVFFCLVYQLLNRLTRRVVAVRRENEVKFEDFEATPSGYWKRPVDDTEFLFVQLR